MRSPLPVFYRWRRLAVLALLCMARAQPSPGAGTEAPAAAGTNLFTNPGFEGGSKPVDNLWDGVDSDGYLAGFKYRAPVITEKGDLGPMAMPPSVALADLNADGKPDLLVADPTGYFRFYLNRGTAGAPRFTSAEIVPIFLSTGFKPREHVYGPAAEDNYRFCPRFALADWRHSGVLDLLVGNYYGETLFVPNTGTPRNPVFRLANGGIDGARLTTSEKQPFWGNLFAPAALDSGHGGAPDLALGEGTYSSNSIHLLRNVSNSGTPKFTDAQHTHIAYGDGREQLIPAAVDYDGDGNTDLLVADRTGEVGVYLNPGKSQPPSTEFKRVATLSFGGKSKLPGLSSVYAADFNGDGLFDVILGMSTGHIAVALNTGTKNAPTFGPLTELKGEGRFGRDINVPDGWLETTFPEYGNALAYISVVDAKQDPTSQPPEGTHCLKAGYAPVPGEIFQMPPEGIPGGYKHFVVYQRNVTLQNNKSYTLSFRTKGVGMEKMHYSFISHIGIGSGNGPAKMERGERGEVTRVGGGGSITEEIDIGGDFHAGSEWAVTGGTLDIRAKIGALKELPTMSGAIYFDFWATGLSSVLYMDDFSLVLK